MKKMTNTTTQTLVTRFSTLLLAPLLLAPLLLMAAGCTETVDTSKEDVRGIEPEEEPCNPDDCIPLSPLLEPCPEGFELSSWSECVDLEGQCVWEFHDDCVPVDEPEPDPVPQGNGGGNGHENDTPGHIRPQSNEAPGHTKHH